MRAGRAIFVGVLLCMLTPGLRELSVDAVHFLAAGHTEHAAEHQDAAPGDAEHGCSGLDHHCHCCVVSVLLPAGVPDVLPPLSRPCLPMGSESGAAEGHRRGLQRPPSA